MTTLFPAVLNMSITASYVALAVILIRMLLKKAPKIFSYVLWLAVLVRLVFPFSFSLDFSFLGFLMPDVQANTGAMEYIPHTIGMMQNPVIDVGIDGINNAVNSSLPVGTPYASVNPMQILMLFASTIWVFGMVALLIYCLLSYIKVTSNVRTATRLKENVFESDRITTPFLCGIIKPKIYVPVGLSETELSCILSHEQSHIQRLDHLVKPFAFLVLIVHWFNPIIWASFALMSKDMEMSCDESALKKMGNAIKGEYSNSLLSLSVKKRGFMLTPLAFGESNIKSRIKNVLHYKKPAVWVLVLTILATASLLVAFTANPKQKQVESVSYSGYPIETLIKNKTPYVGNNSKVVALIDAMPLAKGYTRDAVSLQTYAVPYGITIYYSLDDRSVVDAMSVSHGYAFYRNAIMLFGLIDNVDVINCSIHDKTVRENGNVLYTFTRKEVDALMGYDVRRYADNADTLKSLIDDLSNKTPLQVNPVAVTNVPDGYTIAEETTKAAADAQIEQYLEIIISSPKASSNPADYVNAHQIEYESILKMGDEALHYLLSQFEKGNNDNLKGSIMMSLCKYLLGGRNNVTDDTLSPQAWYSKLTPYEETKLPDFKAAVSDPIEQLVYDAAVVKYTRSGDGFTVVAPTIFGSYEEGNQLKIFATVYSNRYRLYGKTLYEVGGSIVPAAITYINEGNGNYTLQEYKECMDGSYFRKSIEDFCTMPVSGYVIKGLSDKILKDNGSNKARAELLHKNLIEHLKTHNLKGISLKSLNNDFLPLT